MATDTILLPVLTVAAQASVNVNSVGMRMALVR
jgi:hypothetical protein